MIASQTAYRVALVAGIALLAMTVLSLFQAPVVPCGGLPGNYPPIIAFELARSVADLQAIFGAANDACRGVVAERMDQINRIDCLFYIPVYGAFLVFFFLGARKHNSKLARFAASIVVIACAADYLENACLFHMSANPDSAWSRLTLLFFATNVKWIGLGIAGVLGGILLKVRMGKLWPLIVALCSLGALASLMALPSPAIAGPYLSPAFAAGWVVFLLIAAYESFGKQ